MFSLFEVLEMRGRLKRIQKEGSVILLNLTDGGSALAKVSSVGLATVVIDIVDEDEETWLANYIFPISIINYVNLRSTERARAKFINQSPEEDCIGCQEIADELDDE
jgi:hypothetical protein